VAAPLKVQGLPYMKQVWTKQIGVDLVHPWKLASKTSKVVWQKAKATQLWSEAFL